MAEATNVKSLQDIIADDFYLACKDRFLRQGKGRRPDVSAPLLSHRVIVQLWDLALNANLPQRKAVEWLHDLYPDVIGSGMDVDRLRSVMMTVAKKAFKLANGGDKIEDFLSTPLCLNFSTEELMKIGLNRNILVSDFGYLNIEKLSKISNKIVLDLDSFQNSEKLEATFAAKWIRYLGNHNIDDKELKNLVKKIKKLKDRKSKLKSNKTTTPQIFTEFLEEEFKINHENRPNLNVKACGHEKEIEGLVKKINELEKSKSVVNNEKQSLLKILAEERDSRKRLEQELLHISSEKADLADKLKLAARQVKTVRQKNTRVVDRVTNLYESKFQALEEENRNLKMKLLKLKTKIKHKEQTVREIKTNVGLDDVVEIKTNRNNTYSDAVRQTCIALQCDAGVSAENTKKVIEIVGSNIFNHEFKENLPCAQTATNMVGEGSIISNIQVSNTILKSKNVTLHTDGTSRDGKKIVGFQISCDAGEPLFLGFEPVATEDAQTTLDIAIKILKKLATCHDNLNKEDTFDQILGKITSVMTDRAAAMKLFGHKLEEFLKSKFGQDVQLHFLKCNAHFLLGLMSECEKALAAVEDEIIKESGEALGRDKEKSFSHFQKEKTVTGRVIRMVCEILGPRGDQKNGCRQDWTVFCDNSKIPCFKGNRFNCFFEAAAAIVFHHAKFKIFVTSGILGDHVNQKIKSVSLDIEDMKIMCLLAAVALFYLKVTLPYWMLVTKSNVKYIDFHVFVKTLYHSLSDWSEDPARLYDRNFKSVFEEINPLSPFFSSVHDFVADKCDMPLVLKVLKALCQHSLQVTERQLNDFIAGKFSSVEEENRETLDHCLLTNLIGESAFGDYDYDVSKRRNASLFNRSAVHTVKRNKTVKFLSKQSPKIRKDMFAIARKLGPEFKQESKATEERIEHEIRTKFVANQEQKIKKQVLELERNSKILDTVKKHGGPCLNKESLDDLMSDLKKSRSSKFITEVLKAEIRFHKTFNHKSSLKFGNIKFMTDSLRNSLPSSSTRDPPSKRRRLDY